jgi:GNAT superfamily N-acetyltransferase
MYIELWMVMKNFESVANHLDFLKFNRGPVRHLGSFAFVESEKPEFTFAYQTKLTATSNDSVLGFNQLYLFKESADLIELAIGKGFQQKSSITHMIFDRSMEAEKKLRTDLKIEEARTSVDIETFGEIQCRAFLTTDAAYTAWASWLKKMNQLNVGNSSQRYLIAYDGETPVAVTLEVIRENSIGIYAVATHPDHRKKGASATLLKHTLDSYPDKTVCLQVQTGSYAHKFYSKQGFRNSLEVGIFSKQTHS